MSNFGQSYTKSQRSSRKKNEREIVQSSNEKNSHSNNSYSNLKLKLVQFLMKAAVLQRKLQIIKEALCQQEEFTPASLFNRIDQDRKGYLIEKDIEKFLNENQMTYKGSELKILYGNMNREQSDKGVALWDFQNFILPNQNPLLRYHTMRRAVYIPLPNQRLSRVIEGILSKLFTQIMIEKVRLAQINASLICSYDFNAENVFYLLANHDNFITGESLESFMQSQKYNISVQQVGCLIKLIDKKGEGRIYLQDFKHFLATLNLKKQHQIFDELSPIPAIKNLIVSKYVSKQKSLNKKNSSPQKRNPQSPLKNKIRGLQIQNSRKKY